MSAFKWSTSTSESVGVGGGGFVWFVWLSDGFGDGRRLDLKGLRDHATRGAPLLCRGLRDWHSRSGEATNRNRRNRWIEAEKRFEKSVFHLFKKDVWKILKHQKSKSIKDRKIHQTRHSLSATSASLRIAQWHQHLQPGNVQSWVVLSEYLVKRMITTFLNHLWGCRYWMTLSCPSLPPSHVHTAWLLTILKNLLQTTITTRDFQVCDWVSSVKTQFISIYDKALAWAVNLPTTRKSALASFAASGPFDHSQVVLSKSSGRLRSVRV